MPPAKVTSKHGANTRREHVKAQAEHHAQGRRETLGTITCPSGTLAIIDLGIAGYLPREALEPMLVKAQVPADRPLTVTGVHVGRGRFAPCWDHVAIDLADGEVQAAKKLGNAPVDFGRLACLDHAALDHWQHEDSLDGRADVVFWGRDEAQLARAMRGATRLREGGGYGLVDLTVDDAEARLIDAQRFQADNRWLVKIEFRPHTHLYFALAAARGSKTGAGTLELAGTQLLTFSTTWGDGVFPVFLDTDAGDRPVRVRIQLATADAAGSGPATR